LSVPARILLLEDQDTDAELITRQLRKALPKSEIHRIASRHELEDELQAFRPHLVISDHNMAQFRGSDALSVVRERAPDVPFILVTGSLDEETAVEYMKAGATDYVLKDRMVRLGPAVRVALDRRRERAEAIQAEAARLAADERYRLVVQATNDVIWDWDLVAGQVWWSENARTLLGDAPGQSRADPLAVDRAHPEDRAAIRAHLTAALEHGGHPLAHQYRFGLADGSYAHVLARGFAVRDAEGQPVRMIGSLSDISDRVHAERKYHDIFERAPLGIYQSSRDGRVLDANPVLARMLGYDSPDELFALHMERDVYLDPAEREHLIARSGGVLGPDVELQWKKKDGSPMWVNLVVQRHYGADGQILYFEGFVRDITDRKRLEDQLRQAQKMEAVGQLAGGIAHDFNNLLTVITGYSELLYDDLGADDPRRADVSEIRQAAARAAQLTRQLLAFSRKQVLQPRALDLNGVVTGIEKMLTRLLGETISVRTKLSPSLGTVRADPGQLEQVLMNLAVNAGDAMPHGGELTIETSEVELDEEYAREHVDAVPGRYVMLAVHDAGVGMEPATQARLFEPFFTTKGPGKGTGLGLSTVYGIVKQSGGHIWVYSEIGQGTTFKVYLPRIDAPADIMPRSPQEAAKRGTETILVVEDADLLRALARRVLEGFGYTVLTAHGGQEALAMAEAHPGPVHLLLTDVVMPEMGGAELAKRLAARRAEILVLYMSGYTDDAIVRQGVLDEGVAFIQKPFTAESLVRRVREVLDASGGARARTGKKARLSS
jgi:PAS domain S-box-containing protein